MGRGFGVRQLAVAFLAGQSGPGGGQSGIMLQPSMSSLAMLDYSKLTSRCRYECSYWSVPAICENGCGTVSGEDTKQASVGGVCTPSLLQLLSIDRDPLILSI